MVATRTTHATNADAESSTSTRTRHRTMMEGNQSQSELTGDSQPEEHMDDSCGPSLPADLSKRETRRSTRFFDDKKQRDSTHEADVSESESCCSVVSDAQAMPRTRRRTVSREKPKGDASEADSCSSAISASRSRRAPRGLRKRVQTPSTRGASKTDDDVSEAESCSSVVSLTKVLDTRRITRSRRKTALAATEADPTEPESCSSSVSGIPCSTVRRSIRIQKEKLINPIPLSLEETTDSPSSPVSRRLRARRHETKSRPSEDLCDSDECKSGPSTTPWRSSRHKAKGEPLICTSDSESVPADVYSSQDSPSSLRRKGTPCSSRTGSSSSNCAVPVTRTRNKSIVTSDLSTTLKCVAALPEDEKEDKHEPVHFQSEGVVASYAEETVELLDNTMTMEMFEAQECTMIENTSADFTPILQPDEKVLEPQSRKENEPLLPVSENTELLENHQEELVDEMATDIESTEDPENNVAMKTNEKNVEDVEEMVECEKAVEVSEDADETVTCMGEPSLLLNDAECPSVSSHTWADLSTTGHPSEISPSQKQMTSLLDSSEEEEASDEGLSADEKEDEGSSQKAVDDITEEEMTCPDEGQSTSGAHSDGLFVIDTRPGLQLDQKYYVDAKQTEEEDEEDFIDEEEDGEDEDSKVLFAPVKPMIQLSSSIDPGLKMKELGGLYISFDGSKLKGVSSSLKTQKNQNNQDELLKNSVIAPDLEKREALPQGSKREAKLKRKTEREKTTGDGWFNMKAPEVTEEIRNDLKVLKMRSAMDPKRFYKKNDREGFPKYFQVGTVMDSPADFFHSRIPKKQRKRTIVEELLADAEFRSYNKRKYQEIVTEKATQAAGKMNKKHKFHKKKMNK